MDGRCAQLAVNRRWRDERVKSDPERSFVASNRTTQIDTKRVRMLPILPCDSQAS
jgi:hypothetical protein